ncbi:MAG: hypothetical protein Q8M31_03365 [Beijerinckiaceae bacterium]|nr:hypothetical protein [Beijerinckiaceae bacterium]
MNERDEHRIAARLAKIMAMICVRNSKLEDLHAGRVPVTRTGDYSDVFVVDADGQRCPWMEISRIDDDEMRDLMRQIVNRLYTFHIKADDPAFRDEIDRWLPVAEKWDEPSEDAGFIWPTGEFGQ